MKGSLSAAYKQFFSSTISDKEATVKLQGSDENAAHGAFALAMVNSLMVQPCPSSHPPLSGWIWLP